MKSKKRKKRLEARRQDYEKTIVHLARDLWSRFDEVSARKAFRCPGSMNK